MDVDRMTMAREASYQVEPELHGGDNMALTSLRRRALVLGRTHPHMGTYSSYKRFLDYLPPSFCNSVFESSRLSHRVLGRAARVGLGLPEVTAVQAMAAARLLVRARRKCDLVHVLYGERHAPIVHRLARAGLPILLTFHHPRSVIEEGTHNSPSFDRPLRDYLSCAHGAIMLSTADQKHYQSLIGKGQMYFLRHGVDCDFFRPSENGPLERRILVVGSWLRDWTRIQEVLGFLAAEVPDIEVDVVASHSVLREPEHAALAEMVKKGIVKFRNGISDDQLLQLYQRSSLLFCPFLDTSANNAIVEALACGLPVVTNNVGGVPDYGGGSVYDVAHSGSTEELAELCLQYLFSPRRRAETAKAQRDFAERELDWPTIARRHVEVYEDVWRSLA